MDNILRSLNDRQLVIDLGCGNGSFAYASYRAKIVGIDLSFDQAHLFHDGDRIAYVRGNSTQIPLMDQSADAVISNHSLEHIKNYEKALGEIGRVLKPTGLLWISVPNGFGVDDALYRFLYAGGGHVNRFRYAELRDAVESITGLKLLQATTLMSGFVYCRRPTEAGWKYTPRPLRLLHSIQPFGRFLPFALNLLTRRLDEVFKLGLGRYGWGFVFGQPETVLEPLHAFYNVCQGCGCGRAAVNIRPHTYRNFGMTFYRCGICGEANLAFNPPAGFE